MNNTTDKRQKENSEIVWPVLERLSSRFEDIKNKREEILYILKNVEAVQQIISKMKEWRVMTHEENTQLWNFENSNWFSTRLRYPRGRKFDDQNIERETHIKDLKTLKSFTANYPYIVEADRVNDNIPTEFGGIIEIQSNWNVWLIKKAEKGIKYLLTPDRYVWRLSKKHKDFVNYGILEIKNPVTRWSISATESIFLKDEWGDWVFNSIWRFHLVSDFDADGIAIAIKEVGKYYFVRKNFESSSKTEIWRALNGTMTLQAAIGKYVIAIDDDIDPNNIDAVLWAMSYRCDPGQDIQIVRYREMGHGPRSEFTPEIDSAMLIDATMKYPMPPLALPKKEYMENAKKIWERLGLPELRPESPWYGYDLGDWSEEWDHNALQATKGLWMEKDQDYIDRRSADAQPNMPVKRKN